MIPMKIKGRSEVASALARVRRLHAMGRISDANKKYIEDRLEEVLTRIASMRELDSDDEEVLCQG